MISLFLANVLGWISAHKAITFLLVVIAVGGIYYACRENTLKDEIRREKQARSDESEQRIDEAKQEVNKASENINAVRNANYSNLNNDELRNRIINAARKNK